jgi:hypothetical protein
MNVLLRDYLPQGRRSAHLYRRPSAGGEIELNNRPRIVLIDRSPAEVYDSLLAFKNPFQVATLTRTRPVAMASFSSVVGT